MLAHFPMYLMGFTKAYHYDSRSAETTLASISFGNALLGRMRLLHISYALDRYDMLAIHANERC